ncbi:MAG: PRC-barrel domain-containing protein [Methanobacteriaceae archaeon]|jgi:sporulation protein YlmC with PRC-barrel domain|nr:PRC-barrel domain-containing protein [Methanobacteriaceae archaeon]
MISLKDVPGMEVIDKEGKNVGKVKKVDFDIEEGKINTITVSFHKGFFSHEKEIIGFKEIKNISDNVLLDIEIFTGD